MPRIGRVRFALACLVALTAALPLVCESGKAPAGAKRKTFPYLLLGKIVSVHDGDTVTLLSGRKQYKIRLNEIDCPEKGQPYGDKARQKLASLIFGMDVRASISGKDRYGRFIGTISAGSLDVNAEMVKTGYAWHYKQYSKSPQLALLENRARAARIGLWADPNPVSPWEWRKRRRK
jgi:micrococcal nuclease